jgi:hypothetical protein
MSAATFSDLFDIGQKKKSKIANGSLMSATIAATSDLSIEDEFMC